MSFKIKIIINLIKSSIFLILFTAFFLHVPFNAFTFSDDIDSGGVRY